MVKIDYSLVRAIKNWENYIYSDQWLKKREGRDACNRIEIWSSDDVKEAYDKAGVDF